jgi:phosphoserine aminotransferase
MFYRTFNPGPSQVSDDTKADIREALNRNIIGISHRSAAFKTITEEAVVGLRTYFKVPDDYHVLFSSSATEAMELVVRNLVEHKSFHFTNGHFSELFARISESVGKQALANAVDWGRQNNIETAKIPLSADIVTLTYNETSTGVIANKSMVRDVRQGLGKTLLVVDITSAAGCVPFSISDADVWLFSVQKGMGLPAGLGIMFVSPRAYERALHQKHAGIFNFERMVDHISTYQTVQTPNVLGIYLLAKQLGRWNKQLLGFNFTETEVKAKMLDAFIASRQQLAYFVETPAFRSPTTICIKAEPSVIESIHTAAKAEQIIIGAGYGKLKPNTCRIANFPALERSDMEYLIQVLTPAVSV